MSTISRSSDVSIRKSPSISATVYPKGYAMRGNDGEVWEIILDSRGTHRWQKKRLTEQEKAEIIRKVRNSIKGMKMLIEDDPSLKEELEAKAKKRLEVFENDRNEEAAKLMREFLRESFKLGGKVQKMGEKEKMYRKALDKTISKSERIYLIKKLNEIDNNKAKF